MTKKLLIALAAITLSMPLLAVDAHRAALTEDGIFYTVDVVTVDEDAIPLHTVLWLSEQKGDDIASVFVPGSEKLGRHFEPSVAWDEASSTLFIFWVYMPSITSTEILFTSYRDGEWSDIVSIDHDTFHYRKNLRLTTTRYHWEHDETGSDVRVAGTAVHVVWWDQWGETAEYALVSFDGGEVRSIERFSLPELIDREGHERSVLAPEFGRSFFETPTITAHPGSDGVEVIFGDVELDALHKIDIIPIRADGVLTIPTGLRGTEPIRPSPDFANITSGDVDILSGGTGSGQIAAVWSDEGRVTFSRYAGGSWSAPKTVLLNERLSYDHVLQGLRKLLGRH